ncbi:hypothetical protein EV424DRAFT_1350238 [Suillus variegatus]|nr:hypothetical protein EV424DRAFT_1350238 [Suillus variegatus]
MTDGPGGKLFLMEAGGPMQGIYRVDEWADACSWGRGTRPPRGSVEYGLRLEVQAVRPYTPTLLTTISEDKVQLGGGREGKGVGAQTPVIRAGGNAMSICGTTQSREVVRVGRYALWCIKVDVYEIDGHDGAEVVVHQPNQRRLSCRMWNPGMWNPGCKACVALREAKFRPPKSCVALRDSKFRPPKYGSTVPTSEFRDPGVDK